MLKSLLSVLLSLVVMLTLGVSSVWAHASVTQKEVGVGARQVFTISVPNEEDVPTTTVRLILPEGLKSVTPNVKQGWTITTVKEGEGEGSTVKEIVWTAGSIPMGQRDEFNFQAQAPASEGTLVWKVHQTYGNGEVVKWETDPKVVQEYTKNNPPAEGEDDHSAPRPWSETKVVNDLAPSQPEAQTSQGTSMQKSNDWTSWGTPLALVLSVVSIGMQLLGKNKSKK